MVHRTPFQTLFPALFTALVASLLTASCSDAGTGSTSTGGTGAGQPSGGGGTSSTAGGSGGSGGVTATGTSAGGSSTTGTSSGGSSTTGTGGATPTFETEVITQRHRFIPGAMFGGWGPHLGHLVRAKAPGAAASSLYWVDDVCSQAGSPGTVCDVLHDTAIGIFRRDGASWTDLGETALPGTVQQNTGSLATSGILRSYGVDVAGHVLQECTFDVATSARACGALPFALDAYANYIGAAVSPQGARMVWWTDVKDGGGGMFEYVVDYGGGWNGPRKGDIGGYNDSSYIHVAFRADTTQFTMHTQLVSGLAPNWSYLGAVGEGDLATVDPVTWGNVLAAPAGDSIASTDDVFIDPATGDTHLFARATSGAAVYYFRPKGGSWSGPLFSMAGVYRLRFSASPVGIAIVYGQANKGLSFRLVAPGAGGEGLPIDWSALEEQAVPLPEGYENIDAIYPESSAYQTEPTQGISVAVVGDARQNEALYVAIHP